MFYKHLLRRRTLLAATACVLGASMSANAGIPRYFAGVSGIPGNPDWSLGANWAGNVPPVTNDEVVYDSSTWPPDDGGYNDIPALTLTTITQAGASPLYGALTIDADPTCPIGLNNGVGGTIIDMSANAPASNLYIFANLGLPLNGVATIHSDRTLILSGKISPISPNSTINLKVQNVQGLATETGGTLILYTDFSPWVGGSQTVTTNLTADPGTNVNFGTNQHLLSLTLRTGAKATITPTNVQLSNKVLVTDALTMDGTSTINIKDNDLLITSGTASDLSAVRQAIRDGRIFTDSTYVSTSKGGVKTTGIGYAAGNDPAIAYKMPVDQWGTPVFPGFFDWPRHVQGGPTGYGEPFTATSILVKYTYVGDANLDGSVDGQDSALWAMGFTGALGPNPPNPKPWTLGDFNYDGSVDGSDIALWAMNFTGALGSGGLSGGVSGEAAAAVPEPAALGLLALGGLLALRRGRH